MKPSHGLFLAAVTTGVLAIFGWRASSVDSSPESFDKKPLATSTAPSLEQTTSASKAAEQGPRRELSSAQQELLQHLSASSEPAQQIEAMHRLRAAPFPGALLELLKLRDSNEPMLIRGLIMSLGSLGPQLSESERATAVETLAHLLERFRSPTDPLEKGHRYLIGKALGKIPDPKALALLKQMLWLEIDNYPGLYLILENLKMQGLAKQDPLLLSLEASLIAQDPPLDPLERETLQNIKDLLLHW